MVQTSPPIAPYPDAPLTVEDWDPRWADAAARIAAIIGQRRPDVVVHHIGSTSVPGLAAKPVIDIGVDAGDAVSADLRADLEALGFVRDRRPGAFPDTRPLFLGGIALDDGTVFKIHLHVHPRLGRYGRDLPRHLAFRDALRADPAKAEAYAAVKRGIVASGVESGLSYSMHKTIFIRDLLAGIGEADEPLAPGSTIGILGGGQLGRMLAMAARRMGYRVAVLDPDAACPAAGVADRVVAGGYGDLAAAREMAAGCDVVTYELEHVDADVVAELDAEWDVRPSVYALRMTQDRLAERRFLVKAGAPVAPWREVHSLEDLRRAAGELRTEAGDPGAALRLKAAIGGYDGRSQVRLVPGPGERPGDELEAGFAALEGSVAAGLLVELELAFACELSQIVARGADGLSRAFPVARNRHDEGILVEFGRPGPAAGGRLDDQGRPSPRDAAGDGARPHRDADRGAVPHARPVARGERACSAGAQQRPLDDGGDGDRPVRAARPGHRGVAPRRDRPPGSGGDGQPARHGAAPSGPSLRAHEGPRGPGGPPPRLR